MLEIMLIGEIGYEITSNSVKYELEKANGEDVKIFWSSPGGSVFEGINIFNQFKNYKGRVDFVLTGSVCSMGSYIPLAADNISAEKNTVYMIHNARSYVSGDHNEMKERAELLEGLSKLLKNEYVKKTCKSPEEITAMMDKETYFFGDEIVMAGFADSMIEDSEEIKEKDIVVAVAKEAFNACMQKTESEKNRDYELAAALIKPDLINIKAKKEKIMNLETLKKEHPEVYKSAINEAITAYKKENSSSSESIFELVSVVAGDEVGAKVKALSETGLTAGSVAILKNVFIAKQEPEKKAELNINDQILAALKNSTQKPAGGGDNNNDEKDFMSLVNARIDSKSCTEVEAMQHIQTSFPKLHEKWIKEQQ